MNHADAVWEVLNMRGRISHSQKLAEIREILHCDEYDLTSHINCIRGRHSRRNKGCRSRKQKLSDSTWKQIRRTRL